VGKTNPTRYDRLDQAAKLLKERNERQAILEARACGYESGN
jgi:hypothetical protein